MFACLTHNSSQETELFPAQTCVCLSHRTAAPVSQRAPVCNLASYLSNSCNNRLAIANKPLSVSMMLRDGTTDGLCKSLTPIG